MSPAKRFFAAVPMLLASHDLLAREAGNDSAIKTILSIWPFIVALVALLLVFLWYQYITGLKRYRRDPGRRPAGKPNSVVFLGIVTVFAIVMFTLPWLLNNFEEKLESPPAEMVMDPDNRMEITLEVEGMTCTGCEGLIQRRVGELPGVESVRADHMTHETVIVYDKSRADLSQMKLAIEEAGYKVVGEKP
jgi:copper chaperone CopZ